MDIIYENITKKDYKDIQDLILKAWYNEYGCSPSLKKRFVKAYFYGLIKDTNFGRKAVVDGKFGGFVLGSINRPNILHHLKYLFLMYLIRLTFLFSKKGRQNLKVDLLTDKVDKKLIKPYRKELQSELTLFIVSENYRKMGIGSKLVDYYIKELKINHVSQFYLFTDTYSNFNYYEKNGYRRLNSIHVVFDKKTADEGDYFIYLKNMEVANENK